MKRLAPLLALAIFTTPLWSTPTLAREALPDSAPADDDQLHTRELLPGVPLAGEELKALFLQTPLDLERSDERKGMSSVREETRYLEEEISVGGPRIQERPANVNDTTPAPPRILPIRGL